MLGSQLAGLRVFYVIAKLIFSVFHRRAEIPANRASPVNQASPPHVIGPLDCHKQNGIHFGIKKTFPGINVFRFSSPFKAWPLQVH